LKKYDPFNNFRVIVSEVESMNINVKDIISKFFRMIRIFLYFLLSVFKSAISVMMKQIKQ